jgi:hypothetical protein
LLAATAVVVPLTNSAHALVINLTYTPAVTSLPYFSQVQNACNYVVGEYESLYSNNITLNFMVNAGTSGLGGSSTPSASFSYSTMRGALAGLSTTADQITAASYLPVSDPQAGNAWYVPNAEQVALGIGSPAGSMGTYTFNANVTYTFDPFNRSVSSTYDFVGVTEHEISEMMGRIPGLGGLKNGVPSYKPFDLYRFTSPGVHDYTAGNNIYFSYDNGNTNLKPFNFPNGGNSDPQDWMNVSGVHDAYNESAGTGSQYSLSNVDLNVMHVLGYNSQGSVLTWNTGAGGMFSGNNWLSSLGGNVNPCHNSYLYVNGFSAEPYYFLSDNENMQLGSWSDMGQALEIANGDFILGAAGSGAGHGLNISQDGKLYVHNTGQLNISGQLNIGNDSASTGAQASFYDNATVNIGVDPGTTRVLDVGVRGTGSVDQNDSASVSTPSLLLGDTALGSGTYTLENTATLTVSGDETIASAGSGAFTQLAGTHTISGNLSLATSFSGNGSFTMSGGTANITGSAYVGGTSSTLGGQGAININSGNFTVGATLKIWNSINNVVNLSGGTLTTGILDTSGAGWTFNWTAGTLHLTGEPLDLIGVADPVAPTNPFGNSLTLGNNQSFVVGNNEWLADDAGNLTQNTGSSNTCEGNLWIGSGLGGAAVYTLNDGSLDTFLSEYVGYINTTYNIGGTGSFIQSGGSNFVEGSALNIAYNAPGSYLLSAGSLSANDIIIQTQGSFHQSGGTLSFSDAIRQSGGTVNLDLGLTIYSGTLVQQTGGVFTSAGVVNNALFEQSGGTASLGAVTGTGTLSIGGGSGPSTTTVKQFSQTQIEIDASGLLQVSPNSFFDNTVSTLTITGNGTLDMANNHMFIDYGRLADPIASVAAWLASGYAGGAWNGPGIMSTTAQSTGASYGLGYADSADPGNPANLAFGTIEIKYTLLGDADLNGVVNGIDFGILAANFNKAATGWDKGDFDYNNVVNGVDFAKLAANFNKGASGAAAQATAADFAALDSFAAANGLLADVPEPAAAPLLVFATAGALARRRARRNTNCESQREDLPTQYQK